MRKTKVIVVLALTVVMLAITTMPAVVSAGELDIEPDGSIQLVPGSYVETTARLSELLGDGTYGRTFYAGVKSGEADDLLFEVFDPWGGKASGRGSVTHDYDRLSGITNYDITVRITAAPGTEGREYVLYYEDVQPLCFDTIAASTLSSVMPEFTTIAIPVASILGLLFYFNHRKRRKG